MKQTLGIFAKQPSPGAVKSRLAAAASPEWAAQVYAAFLLDLLDRLTSFAARRVVAYDPPRAIAFFEEAGRGRFELVAQASGDLGQRLASFFRSDLEAGSERVVLIGTDSPTLPVERIAHAFDELANADLVLGPATDGGYYLIGCARRVPDIFTGVDWSSSRVLEQTMARLKNTGTKLALLPPWYDVDTLDDWNCLRGHVAALRYAGIDPQIPRTESLLTLNVPPLQPLNVPPLRRGGRGG